MAKCLIQACFWLEWKLPILAQTIHYFHHIRPVTTITDSIPIPCKNHPQIAAAQRVPASRGARTSARIAERAL